MNKKLKVWLIIIFISIICLTCILFLKTKQMENKDKITTDLLNWIEEKQLNIFDQYGTNIDFRKIDEQKKLEYAYWHLKNNHNFTEGVSKNVFESLFLEVFGNNEINHQNIKCFCGYDWLVYDEEKGIYHFSELHPGHGGPSFAYGANYNKFVSLTIDNNKYRLTVSKLFISLLNETYSSYPLDEKYHLFKGNMEDTSEEVVNHFEENYQEYSDKMIEYVYTFEYKDGKYILINYEILK